MVIMYSRLRRPLYLSLVFVITVIMGKNVAADLVTMKQEHYDLWRYSGSLAWIRCTLYFSLLRSAAVCICGSRSISY